MHDTHLRIGIIGAADSWHVRDLRRAARGSGRSATSLEFESLAAGLGENRAESSLDKFAAVIVRGMPRGTLEQIIFRMDVLGEFARRGGTVVNSPRALEISIDKYLALSRMQQSGLTVPETIVCQSVNAAIEAFEALGGDVVLKPLFGSEGRGLVRLRNKTVATQEINSSMNDAGVFYLQRFVEHAGYDYRVLVVGERVFGMRRSNPHDWRLNVKQGASAEPIEVPEALAAIAHRAAGVVGATVAGIDILPQVTGELHVLEVNAVPGWKALSRVTGDDIAKHVLQHAHDVVKNRFKVGGIVRRNDFSVV